MSTIHDQYLKLLVMGQQIVQDYGLRQNRVIVRKRVWSEGVIQTGTATVTDLEILPSTEVKVTAGDPNVKVGPIVPAGVVQESGTYTPEQLNPPDSPGMEWNYILIGRDGVERPFKLMQLEHYASADSSFRYGLTLTSLGRVVPF